MGLDTDQHAAALNGGEPGILHGNRTYLLQDEDGQIIDAHSISAGLDYPGIGPEHSFLKETGRAEYLSCTDQEALDAFQLCTKLEGIIPALEPAHALARVGEVAKDLGPDGLKIMNLCGRGDKDVFMRFIAWAVLPHHFGDKTKVEDEDGLMSFLRNAGISSGNYFFPYCGVRKGPE